MTLSDNNYNFRMLFLKINNTNNIKEFELKSVETYIWQWLCYFSEWRGG